MPLFDGQHFAILGAGRSGLGAAKLARLHGARVTVFDEGEAASLAGGLQKLHDEGFATVTGQVARDLKVGSGQFSRVIISPGLDEHWPLPTYREMLLIK